jgi:hypothetical protein
MSPEESAVPHSDGTEMPTRAENLARLATLKERKARLRQFADLIVDIDRLEADADELEETQRRLRSRVTPRGSAITPSGPRSISLAEASGTGPCP